MRTRQCFWILWLFVQLMTTRSNDHSYKNHQVWRVKVSAKVFGTFSTFKGLDIWNEGQDHVDIMLAPEEWQHIKTELNRLGYNYTVMIKDLNVLINLEKVYFLGHRSLCSRVIVKF